MAKTNQRRITGKLWKCDGVMPIVGNTYFELPEGAVPLNIEFVEDETWLHYVVPATPDELKTVEATLRGD